MARFFHRFAMGFVSSIHRGFFRCYVVYSASSHWLAFQQLVNRSIDKHWIMYAQTQLHRIIIIRPIEISNVATFQFGPVCDDVNMVFVETGTSILRSPWWSRSTVSIQWPVSIGTVSINAVTSIKYGERIFLVDDSLVFSLKLNKLSLFGEQLTKKTLLDAKISLFFTRNNDFFIANDLNRYVYQTTQYHASQVLYYHILCFYFFPFA